MVKVSIVIRSYNEEQHVDKLLRGIHSQTHENLEVILVDSGSTDQTVDIAQKQNVKIVKIPKSEFSFGRALNLGCAAASGDILLFASAHVYPLRQDWIEHIIAPFNDPAIELSYGRQVGNEVTQFSEHRLFESWFPTVSVRRQSHNFCNNANCAIRRSSWLQQPYDELLTGLEDLAWAKKTKQRGGHISYVAEAPVAHVHEETSSRIRNRYRREALALRQIEPNINFGIFDFISCTTKNIWSDLRVARKQNRIGREFTSILMFRINQFYGTWRGHQMHGEIDSALRTKFYYPANPALPRVAIESDPPLAEKAILYD